MDLGNIIWSLMANPNTPKPYRVLRDFFAARDMPHEAESVDLLIRERFGADRPTGDRQLE